ncbi:hypothetical protein C9Z16_23135, partial [Escherichia coli]
MVCPDKRNWKNCCWYFASVSAGCGVRSAYGGDFGDTPNDRQFCMNGL